jgi:hypothetical protein
LKFSLSSIPTVVGQPIPNRLFLELDGEGGEFLSLSTPSLADVFVVDDPSLVFNDQFPHCD